MSDKVKKPLWKRWWVWVAAIIIIIIAASGGGNKPATTTAPSAPDAPKAPAAPAAPAPPKNNPGISKVEFEKIENGMTYEQVVEIVGGPGELMSEVGAKGDQFHSAMYIWKGESGIGANANVTFQAGKMQAKAQAGLK